MRGSCSFAPLGLVGFLLFPRLAPWAAFLRRFAAEGAEFCSSASREFRFSRTR